MPPRRQTFTQAERDQIVNQAVAEALAARNQAKPCTFKDFLRCKPPNFVGTEGAVGLIRWFEKMESIFYICNCPDDCKVMYATYTLQDNASIWWNFHARIVGIDAAHELPWEELKRIMRDKYCPCEELHKLEDELWHLTVKSNDIETYTNRFQQLAHLCPTIVNPESQRIERYIGGLPLQIEGMVTASKPATINDAVRMAHKLMAQVVRRGTPATENQPGQWNGNSSTSHNPTNQPEPVRSYTTEKRGYAGNKPFCHGCKRHHDGSCGLPCERCQRFGHKIWDCRVPANPDSLRVCFKCKEPGHYKNDCPKRKRKIHLISDNDIGTSFLENITFQF